jgi:uncharacterized protein DUF4136
MKKSLRVPVRFIWVFASVVILQACYPGGSIPLTDLDTTSTLYDTDDLAVAPKSAAIVWEVVQEISDDGDDLDYDGEADDEILNTTLQELVNLYGTTNVAIIWKDSTTAPTPAVMIPNIPVFVPGSSDPQPSVETVYAPKVLLRNKRVVIVYPGYPWWGGGGWWGGWYPGGPGGCYYCGYPSYGSVTYQVGTVVLEMYDLRKIPPGAGIPSDFDMSWIGIMRGLLSHDQSTSKARVVSGIQKAFAQSPYLN